MTTADDVHAHTITESRADHGEVGGPFGEALPPASACPAASA
jgi:hypothetical protein